jgi:hypothetical protein
VNELIQTLIECLKQEASHYRKLAVLADQQKELLMAGKVEVLPENVRLEEKQVFALGPLIAQRNELLGKMAKFFHLKTLNLTEALRRAPVEIIEEFKKAVIELVQSARKLEEINKSNEKLLNNALSYVNFTLKIITNGGKKKVFSPLLTREEKKSSFVNRVV